MTLRVISQDYDGCIFNNNYHLSTDKDVIAHNKKFLDKLVQENKNFSHVITMIGSNRQSKEFDVRGSKLNKTISCLLACQQITHYMNATLAPFLLADIYGNLAAGTSYHRMTSKLAPQEKHCSYINDDSKLQVIYAQIQHIANAYPNEAIVFDFYDDMEDILCRLGDFFNKYPEMIPKNVNLQLNHYAGDEALRVTQITGTGSIDSEYYQTTIDMMELTGYDLCVMPIADVMQEGLTRCYIWDRNELSYMTSDGELQRNIPVKDVDNFAIINIMKERECLVTVGHVSKIHLNKALIDKLINSSKDMNPVTFNDVRKNINRICTDEITPELLANYKQSSISVMFNAMYTRKTVNMERELDFLQKLTDNSTFDLYLNAPLNLFKTHPVEAEDDQESICIDYCFKTLFAFFRPERKGSLANIKTLSLEYNYEENKLH